MDESDKNIKIVYIKTGYTDAQKRASKKWYESHREDLIKKAKERYQLKREIIIQKAKERYHNQKLHDHSGIPPMIHPI
jgi:hypothetical protein